MTCDTCCDPDKFQNCEPAWRGQIAEILCEILAALDALNGGGEGTGCDCVTDGSAIVLGTSGGLAFGSDGLNYRLLQTNTVGALVSAEALAEDSASVSGDKGFLALTVRNDNKANVFTSANADYSAIAVNNHGAVFNAESVFEDSAHASGDSGFQALAVIQATPAASAADGDYGSFKTDALGKLWTAGNQVEDAAHASGDRGSFSLGVRNTSLVTYGSDQDYAPVGVGTYGESLATLIHDNQLSQPITPIRLEDSAHTSGDAGVPAWGVNNEALGITFNSTAGDYTPIAVDRYGRQAIFSIQAGTAGSAELVKAEDAVAASGDAGVVALAVQTDTPASTAADGDYGWLKTDALGKLWTADCQVEDVAHASGDRGSFVLGVANPSLTAFAASGDYCPISTDTLGRLAIFSVQGSGGASLLKDEDAVAASGDSGVMALGVIQATLASSAADGDYGSLKTDAVGALYTTPGTQAYAVNINNTLAFGGVTTTYATLLTNSARCRMFSVYNGLDKAVAFSLDAGATSFAYAAPGETKDILIGNIGRDFRGSISVASFAANATSGSITASLGGA